MPKFKVESQSQFEVNEVYFKVKKFFADPSELKKWDPNLSCRFDDSNQEVYISGKQFQAQIKLIKSDLINHTDKNSNQESLKKFLTTLIMEVEIPFVLSPFKGKISESIRNKINKVINT